MEIDCNLDEDDTVTTATQSRKKTPSLPPTVRATPVELPAPVPEPDPTAKAAQHAPPGSVPTPATLTAEQEAEEAAERRDERARMRLADLEYDIKETAAEIGGVLKCAVPHARRVGEFLIRAKVAVRDIDGGPTFAGWVRSKCGMTVQSANRYVRIAANWDRMAGAGYEPTSIEDADGWVARNPAPDADRRGGANNQTGPRVRKLRLPKSFLSARRLRRSGKSAGDWKAVVNEALRAAGQNFQFV